MSGSWFLSRSGLELDLAAPKVADVHWHDIAEALAKTCRFGGHCKGFYSVAEHSVRTYELMNRSWPELAIYGLLHDAAEAWTGDVIHPLKEMIRPLFDPIEAAIEAVIWEAAGISAPTSKIAYLVKHYDLVMLATERRDLLGTPKRPWRILEGIKPDAEVIVPYESWEDARTAWLYAVNSWFGKE